MWLVFENSKLWKAEEGNPKDLQLNGKQIKTPDLIYSTKPMRSGGQRKEPAVAVNKHRKGEEGELIKMNIK